MITEPLTRHQTIEQNQKQRGGVQPNRQEQRNLFGGGEL